MGGNFYACFLDEKWFYITSRRRKMKLLCAQAGESEEHVSDKVPTTRSRRFFPVKSMFLGVVSNPIHLKNFDGKILLICVSRTEVYQQRTHTQSFSKHATTNAVLRNGEWYDADTGLVVEEMTLGDLQEALAAIYQLEEEVAERLITKCYRNPNAPPKKRKVVYINDPSAKIPTRDVLQKKRHSLAVRMEKGDKREVGTSCDSAFMMKAMSEVGTRIREK